jgi:hypothetical protein
MARGARFALIKREKRCGKYKIFCVYSICGRILPVEWVGNEAKPDRGPSFFLRGAKALLKGVKAACHEGFLFFSDKQPSKPFPNLIRVALGRALVCPEERPFIKTSVYRQYDAE